MISFKMSLILFWPLMRFMILVFSRYSKPINLIKISICLECRNLEYLVRVPSFSASFGFQGAGRVRNFRGVHHACSHEQRSWSGHMWNLVIAAPCWHSLRIFSSGTIFCLCWWPWREPFSCPLECWLVSLPEHGSRVAELPCWRILGQGCLDFLNRSLLFKLWHEFCMCRAHDTTLSKVYFTNIHWSTPASWKLFLVIWYRTWRMSLR
jgi:hypothetical protein